MENLLPNNNESINNSNETIENGLTLVDKNLDIHKDIKKLAKKKKDIVQVKNPKTGKYIKIDRDKGRILSNKKSVGKYKGIPIARKKRE